MAMRLVIAAVAVASMAASAQTLAPLQPLPSGRVTYFIAQGEPGSEFRTTDTELAAWALRAWENALGGVLKFEQAA